MHSGQETVEGLEKERDFYFGKLREVEVLAQDENVEFTRETVLAILYKTDEDGEAGPACSIRARVACIITQLPAFHSMPLLVLTAGLHSAEDAAEPAEEEEETF